jgi:hypothetical protein
VTIQDKTVDPARLERTITELLALIGEVKQTRGPRRRQYTIVFEKTSVVVTIERATR